MAVEYENDFLPLIHKLWSPIVQRFNLDDLVVKIRIIYLLFDLSVLCGEFLHSRFVGEFLKPRLCAFMHEQSKLSSNQDAAYVYTQVFKLQVSILTNVDKMCILFEIKDLDLECIIETIVLNHLDKRQPKKLQMLAVDALQNMSLIDSDIVWLCLHYILPVEELGSDRGQKEASLSYSKFIKRKKNFSNIQFSDEILRLLFDLLQSI